MYTELGGQGKGAVHLSEGRTLRVQETEKCKHPWAHLTWPKKSKGLMEAEGRSQEEG